MTLEQAINAILQLISTTISKHSETASQYQREVSYYESSTVLTGSTGGSLLLARSKLAEAEGKRDKWLEVEAQLMQNLHKLN